MSPKQLVIIFRKRANRYDKLKEPRLAMGYHMCAHLLENEAEHWCVTYKPKRKQL